MHDQKPENTQEKPKSAANKKRTDIIAKLEWSFWADSAWAIWGLVLATFLMSPLFEFVGVTMKIYSVAAGICVAFCAVIMFVAHSFVINREGRSTVQREEQDEQYKQELLNRIRRLDSELDEAKRKLAAQEPRRLTKEQQDQIGKAILPYAGQKASIRCNQSDEEAMRYAQQFHFVIVTAKWSSPGVVQANGFSELKNVVVGVNREDSEKNQIPPAANAINKALNDLGISSSGNQLALLGDIGRGEVCIWVLVKPIPSE